MRHLPIDQFLERVSNMPDLEAEEELLLRRESNAATVGRAQFRLAEIEKCYGRKTSEAKELGHVLQAIGAESGRLVPALHLVRGRIERVKWSNAVRSVFGDDGWAACREWMALNSATPTPAEAHAKAPVQGAVQEEEALSEPPESCRG